MIIGLDLHSDDKNTATEQASVQILQNQPEAIIVRLHDVKTEFLPPIPCPNHASECAKRGCPNCDFRPGCIAITPQRTHHAFPVEVTDGAGEQTYKVRVSRRQTPMTIRTASTLHTLQGTTTDPGLIFHWKFARFMSAEMRWLATYVALSRPRSLSKLISVGMPKDMRDIIEGGPPEGILSKFNEMFNDKETNTHLLAEQAMQELGWKDT